MAFGVDWAAVWGAVTATAVAALGIAASYGSLRNRVANHEARMTQQDERIDHLVSALERATSIGNQVELLSQRTESSHKLLQAGQDASQTLMTTKFEALAAELRSFIQGQASMAARRRAVSKSS